MPLTTVNDHLRRLLGGSAEAFFVSARGALEPSASVAGRDGPDPPHGFVAFRDALRAFVVDELAAVRRQRVRRARRQLGDEPDKHAGRARHDVVERLRETARRFVGEMAGELEETERSSGPAADRPT